MRIGGYSSSVYGVKEQERANNSDKKRANSKEILKKDEVELNSVADNLSEIRKMQIANENKIAANPKLMNTFGLPEELMSSTRKNIENNPEQALNTQSHLSQKRVMDILN